MAAYGPNRQIAIDPPNARSRRHRGAGLLGVILLIGAMGSAGGVQDSPESPGTFQRLLQTAQEIQKFGPWEEQYAWIDRSMVRLWEQNGWKSEADQFTLQVLRDVAKIPPWQIPQRFDRLGQHAQERYGLADPQVHELKSSMMRELTGLFVKHAPTIVKQVREQVELRIDAPDDEAFLRELQPRVAAWARETDALHRDAMEALDRVYAGFESSLTPEQKPKFRRDHEALNHLTSYVDRMRTLAAEGQFRPEDYGLTREEFLQFMHQARSGPSASASAAASAAGDSSGGERTQESGRVLKHDPSTWPIHVRDFVRRYQLDKAQEETADSILVEMVERADRYIRARRADLDKIEPPQRATHAAYNPVIELFEILDTRLRALPRREQKDAVERPPPGRPK